MERGKSDGKGRNCSDVDVLDSKFKFALNLSILYLTSKKE
jgi:hypothetical protein